MNQHRPGGRRQLLGRPAPVGDKSEQKNITDKELQQLVKAAKALG